MNIVLWVLQVLVALMFVFAGVGKFMMPAETLESTYRLPALFIQFVGVCEVIGAIGLILPSALRIRPMLTPLAAVGLAIITLGATVTTIVIGGGATALFPFILALLSFFIAYGRTQLAPIAEKSDSGNLQPNR